MSANDILMNIYPDTTRQIFCNIYEQVMDNINFMKEASDIDDILDCRENLESLLPILYGLIEFINKHNSWLIHKNEYDLINKLRIIFNIKLN